jgi:hypothetical protein
MMSYATYYPWLRHGFVRIQSAERVIQRLPAGANRKRALAHLEAAEAALRDIDNELEAQALLDSEEREAAQ